MHAHTQSDAPTQPNQLQKVKAPPRHPQVDFVGGGGNNNNNTTKKRKVNKEKQQRTPTTEFVESPEEIIVIIIKESRSKSTYFLFFLFVVTLFWPQRQAEWDDCSFVCWLFASPLRRHTFHVEKHKKRETTRVDDKNVFSE